MADSPGALRRAVGFLNATMQRYGARGCLVGVAILIGSILVSLIIIYGSWDDIPFFSSGPDAPVEAAETDSDDDSNAADQGTDDAVDPRTGAASTEDPSEPTDAEPGAVVDAEVAPGEGAWTIVEGPPAVDCNIPGIDTSSLPIGSSTTYGDFEVVAGGERLIASSTEPGRAVLEIPRVDTDDDTVKYEATIPATEFGGPDATGEFTFTITFDADDHADTALAGSIGIGDTSCQFSRTGEATFTG